MVTEDDIAKSYQIGGVHTIQRAGGYGIVDLDLGEEIALVWDQGQAMRIVDALGAPAKQPESGDERGRALLAMTTAMLGKTATVGAVDALDALLALGWTPPGGDAYRAGAEAMREAAAKACEDEGRSRLDDGFRPVMGSAHAASIIRALPLPECPRCGSDRVIVREMTMDAGEVQSADFECDNCGHRDTRVYRNFRNLPGVAEGGEG